MAADKKETSGSASVYARTAAASDINDPKYDAFRRSDASWTSPMEILKTIVASLLLPIKIGFSIWWLIIYAIYVRIGRMHDDVTKAPTRWSRFWASSILDSFKWIGFKQTDWFTFALGYPFIKSFGDNSLTCKETGEKANIIVSNHCSYLDIFLLMTSSEQVPGFVAKSEVKKVPLFGWISFFWRCIYVDRAGTPGSKSVVEQMQERALDTDYPPIVVFPEGTTSNNKFILPFKSGAFVGGHSVKPVVIKYPFKKFSPAWESCKAPYHMMRMLLQVYNHCEIYWLPVYVPNEEEKKNPKLYANNVREAILQVSGLLDSPASLEDKIAYLKACRGEFDAE